MADLLPCPFCGSTNLRYEFAGSQGYIECNECGTEGPCDERAADPYCDDDAACDAWNRRAALAGIPMKLSDLLPYLLANRHRLTGDTIADCLDLALMLNESPPGRRILWQTLADRWSCRSAPHISQRLKRLQKADLLDYEPGCPRHPGYRFHRIGPA